MSSQRPCGVWTALRRISSQCVHRRTAPMGAA
jgi:hypothetical protein